MLFWIAKYSSAFTLFVYEASHVQDVRTLATWNVKNAGTFTIVEGIVKLMIGFGLEVCQHFKEVHVRAQMIPNLIQTEIQSIHVLKYYMTHWGPQHLPSCSERRFSLLWAIICKLFQIVEQVLFDDVNVGPSTDCLFTLPSNLSFHGVTSSSQHIICNHWIELRFTELRGGDIDSSFFLLRL